MGTIKNLRSKVAVGVANYGRKLSRRFSKVKFLEKSSPFSPEQRTALSALKKQLQGKPLAEVRSETGALAQKMIYDNALAGHSNVYYGQKIPFTRFSLAGKGIRANFRKLARIIRGKKLKKQGK